MQCEPARRFIRIGMWRPSHGAYAAPSLSTISKRNRTLPRHSHTLPRHSREGGNLHLPASNLTEQNSRTTIGLWRLSETTTQGGSPMRETSELPTTSLRAPNRHSSFPDLPTSFPYPPTSFPRRRESNSPSTQSDRILHNPIKSYENSCVRVTRTRARGTEFHFLSLPRHSREGGNPFSSLPRHSREGGNPFSRHGLPPDHSGSDVPLGVPVS